MVRTCMRWMAVGAALLSLLLTWQPLGAAEVATFRDGHLDPKGLVQSGGVIGYVLIALSVATVAVIIEHLLSIRKSTLMPRPLVEQLQQLISQGQYQQADALCRQQPTFLSYVVMTGLREANYGYASVERAMEEACAEQAGRLSRKIESLSVIGTIAPMLGLMGTVWGMIQAFAEFAVSANPMPTDFAPAISEALVSTLFGLCVAIPAISTYSWFRNRIDEHVTDIARTSEQLIAPLRRALLDARKPVRTPAPVKQPVGS